MDEMVQLLRQHLAEPRTPEEAYRFCSAHLPVLIRLRRDAGLPKAGFRTFERGYWLTRGDHSKMLRNSLEAYLAAFEECTTAAKDIQPI